MNLMNPTKMKNADSGRTNRAMFNSFFAVGSYALLMISNFITRKVFNDQLGLELSGVENQFKSVISMLSLAELGIGTGLVYLLYKPILDNDRSAIRRILNFYQSAYRVIAVIIASFGVVLSFFNHRLFENNTYNPVYFGIIFFLFTCDTLAAYLFANQRALIIADQKNYVNNINEMIMVLMTTVLQVTLLIALPKKYLLQNFLIYVIVKVACRVAAALLIHRNFRRLYPDIAADRDRTSISREERQSVLKNIRAMLFHKIGGFGITASGNVIIPALLGAIYNGVYGNYMLIVITLNQLVSQVFGGITASFGNFLNSGDISASFKKFKELYHLNFLLVSLFTTGTFVLMSVLVEVVGGPGSVLPSYAAVLLSVYFFVNTMRRVIFMVRDSAGLYRPDRYMPLVEFAINVGVSILLVTQTGLGVVGVVIGGLVSMLVIPFWIQPIIVYRDVFKQRPGGYFVRYGVYALATAASCLVTMAAADRIAPVYSGYLVQTGQTVECQVPQPNPDKEIIVYCRSDDPAVLTAEDDGAITGVSPGSTTVQLKTSGGKSAQYVFHTVERQPMNKWLAILVRGGLVLVIPTGLSLLLFWKTEENKAVLALMKQVLKKFIIRNA